MTPRTSLAEAGHRTPQGSWSQSRRGAILRRRRVPRRSSYHDDDRGHARPQRRTHTKALAPPAFPERPPRSDTAVPDRRRRLECVDAGCHLFFGGHGEDAGPPSAPPARRAMTLDDHRHRIKRPAAATSIVGVFSRRYRKRPSSRRFSSRREHACFAKTWQERYKMRATRHLRLVSPHETLRLH